MIVCVFALLYSLAHAQRYDSSYGYEMRGSYRRRHHGPAHGTIQEVTIMLGVTYNGTHHSVSEAHLHRYLVEWDFKFNTRKLKDGERAALIAKGIEGKRLTYRPTH
jgi:hypothetical protein